MEKISTVLSLLLVVVVVTILMGTTTGQENPHIIERSQQLSGQLLVNWTVNFDENMVTFVVTSATHGFIGFGLSPNGGMNGADVIIGGVDDNGDSYFSDRYAATTEEPKIDDHQDWFLIEASEDASHTVLKFSRLLDTCDDQDLAITNDTTKFIWSLGETDTIVYHGANRGSSSVNVLDPPMPEYDTSIFEFWDIQVNTTIPPVDTTYWCTVHKSPRFSKKMQIVGFAPQLDTPAALKHNHHFNLRHCKVEKGSADWQLLESYLGHPGGLCYDEDGTGIQVFQRICTNNLYVWAKGGSPVFLPDHVGYPINDDGTEEYFFLDMHYDNPDELAGVQYDTGVRMYLTDDLRPIDAGLLVVSYAIDNTQIIPPSSTNFVYSTHCSPTCTKSKLTEEGVEMFNVLHHAHLAGQKMKFRHFRPQADGNYTELPWISYDDNYDFDFQQNRPLRENIKLLPGDQLTMECTYDSTYRNPPSTTFGGYSTREEMCQAHIMYYPKGDLGFCGSHRAFDALLPILGIDQVDSSINPADPIVLQPEEYAGLSFSEVLNTKVDWSPEVRAELQMSVHYSDHVDDCHGKKMGNGKNEKDILADVINYPKNFVEYVPPKGVCEE